MGSNLIESLVKRTKYKIISLDNYSTGSKKNHINHKRVSYIKANTFNINIKLKNIKINYFIFHFEPFL